MIANPSKAAKDIGAVNIVISILLLLSFAFSGCASNTATREQIQRAYAAGVQAGKLEAQQQAQSGLPQVKFLGHVRNPVLLWSDSLTLAKALVQAEYLDQTTPAAITIYRNGQAMRVDLQSFLAGQGDYPLFAGDMVVIQN